MSEAPFFHVGILVPDLTEAIDRFGAALGLEFATPARTRIPELAEDGRTGEFEVHVSYSRQGPPHFELIEAAGHGVYSADRGYGVHHIGTWIEDVDAYVAHLREHGIRTEATFRDGPTDLGAYFRPADLHGVRLEACPLVIRPGWEEWVAGTGSGPR